MNKPKSAITLTHYPGILFLILMVFLFSCKTTRSTYKKPIKEEGPEYLFEQLSKNELKFDWFSAKFKTDYRYGKKKTEFRGQIRIRKDSVIWISFSPLLGIEAARLMITNDSVKFMDRLSNTYFVGDYDFVNNFLKTNIDFDILQAFITGNDFHFYERTKFRASIDSREYRLNTLGRSKLKKYVKTSEQPPRVYIQTIWLNPESFKITRICIKEIQKENKKLTAFYSDFREVEDQLFPYALLFELSKNIEEKIEVDVKYTKTVINKPLSFPFKIPSKFEPIE